MANLRDLSNVAYIVGVDESDEMGTLPHKSQLSLHVEAVHQRHARRGAEDLRDSFIMAAEHAASLSGTRKRRIRARKIVAISSSSRSHPHDGVGPQTNREQLTVAHRITQHAERQHLLGGWR
jgi:hypothetical protein